MYKKYHQEGCQVSTNLRAQTTCRHPSTSTTVCWNTPHFFAVVGCGLTSAANIVAIRQDEIIYILQLLLLICMTEVEALRESYLHSFRRA